MGRAAFGELDERFADGGGAVKRLGDAVQVFVIEFEAVAAFLFGPGGEHGFHVGRRAMDAREVGDLGDRERSVGRVVHGGGIVPWNGDEGDSLGDV